MPGWPRARLERRERKGLREEGVRGGWAGLCETVPICAPCGEGGWVEKWAPDKAGVLGGKGAAVCHPHIHFCPLVSPSGPWSLPERTCWCEPVGKQGLGTSTSPVAFPLLQPALGLGGKAQGLVSTRQAGALWLHTLSLQERTEGGWCWRQAWAGAAHSRQASPGRPWRSGTRERGPERARPLRVPRTREGAVSPLSPTPSG